MSKKCAVLSLLYRKTTKRPSRKTVQRHESKSTSRSHTTPETFIAAEVAVLSSSRSSRSSRQKLSTSRSLDSHQKKSDVETHRSFRRLDYKLSPLKTRRGLAVKASFTKNVSPHKISPNTRYVKYRTTRYVRARFAGFGSATWDSTNLEDTSAICCKMLAPFFTFADFGVSLCRELE